MGSVETGSDSPLDIEKVTSQTGGQYAVKLGSEKPNATTRAKSTPEIPLNEEATAASSLEAHHEDDTATRAHGSPLNRFLALAALACMWSSAQIPIFLFGMFDHGRQSFDGADNELVGSWRTSLHLR